jgi:hypothetical protein
MLRLILAIDRLVYVRELLHALLHLGLVLWPLAWVLSGRLSTRALVWAAVVMGGSVGSVFIRRVRCPIRWGLC